jgi:ABC-2 type transport system permease protein
MAAVTAVTNEFRATNSSQLWPNIWLTLLMGLITIPLGLWVFRQAERYAKRPGKLHRNG